MNNTNYRQRGMTLMSLITAVAIVAILTMFATVNYSEFQQRARRMEAKSALKQISELQERHYVTNFTYTNDLTRLGFPSNQTESGLYALSVPIANAAGFQAVAVPAPGSPQANDDDCQQFTIDDQNVRASTPDPDGKCW